MEKFYKVIAKCGHVGREKYIPIMFAVKASSGKEAASKVKVYPRVKKHLKNNIISCNEIDVNEFNEIMEINNNDEYLKCINKQQQNLIANFKTRVIDIDEHEKFLLVKNNRKERRIFVMKKNEILDKANQIKWEDLYEYSY